ncbi:hypothetical protein vseg_019963 [Gypsophila vaccaria]
MGSNMSTVNVRKAPVTTFEENAVPHAYNRSKAHRWSTSPVAKHEKAVTTPVLPPNNYKRSSDDNEIEIIRPTTFLDHSGHINKVISFHSSRCWREYFQASKQSDKLIVIFFWATWCGFCRYVDPVLDDLAARYMDVEIHKIDVDELYDISREFGVHAMPTFLFIKRGKVVDKVTGTRLEDIRSKIERNRV